MGTGIHPLHGHYNLGGFVALLILAGVFTVAWIVPNFLTRNIDDHYEMFVSKNAPYTVARALPVVGLGYALQSVVGFSTTHWWQQALWAIGDGVGVLILFAILVPVLNFVFRKAHGGIHAMLGGSINVALVAGMYVVSFGLVVGSVLPGPGYGIVRMVGHSLVFVLVGAALITVLYMVAAKRKMFAIAAKSSVNSTDGSSTDTVYTPALSDAPRTKRSLAFAIENGNWSATMFAATFLFGLGVLTSAAAASAYDDELKSLITLVVATIITLGVSVAVMWVVDKVVITNATLKEVIEQDMVLPTAVACAFLLATFLAASWLVH
jgi:hypothetical protein